MLRTYRTRHGRLSHFDSDTTIRQSLDLYGEWGEAEIHLLSRWLRKGDTALDVGANVGTHSLAFARIVGREGRVVSFEAQHKVYQLLGMNMLVNGAFHVDCLNVLAGNDDGLTSIPATDVHGAVNFGAASFAGALPEATRSLPIAMARIDSLDLPGCAIMKVDVEGMEIEVFQGAVATIRRHQPIVYFEQTGPRNFDLIWEFFRRLDYGMFWHVSNPFTANNFNRNSHNIFGGTCEINVVAVPPGRADIARELGGEACLISEPVFNPALPENTVDGWILPDDAYADTEPLGTAGISGLSREALEADYQRLQTAHETLVLQHQDLVEDRRKAQTIMEVQLERINSMGGA